MFREYCRRLGLLLSGLAVSAVGIVLMLQANIGLEPWSVLQQGIAKTFGITYGTAASIVGPQSLPLLILRGEFRPRYAGKYFRLPDIHRHPVVPELDPFV